jgi:acyl-CoA dehydrogenase
MADDASMLAEAVTRLLADYRPTHGAAGGVLDPALWQEGAALGLPSLLVDEAAGGVGAGWSHVYAVVHALGAHAAAAPFAESMLASRILAACGQPIPEGPLSIAARADGALRKESAGWRYSGRLHGVPWGRDALGVVACVPVAGRPHAFLLDPAAASARHHAQNLAGEARDDLEYADVAVQATPTELPEAADLFATVALLRAAQMAGACEAALQLSLEYARQRQQFGRPIGNFQAIQQSLAVFGGEAAAAHCAAHTAFRALERGEAGFQMGAAKLRANLAAGVATATAHQVHGAIGFTDEHALHRFTQRLWSWRSECGNDRYWSQRLGAEVARAGADAFWPQLTARDDAVSASATGQA